MAEVYESGAGGGEGTPGASRSLSEVSREELLTSMPMRPVRPSWMVTRFPVDMPEYQRLVEQARQPESATAAAAFEETFGITYPSIPDPDGAVIASMDGSVSPNAVPTTLILDAEGRVAARIAGAADQSTLESLLDAVLAEAA